MSYLVLDQRCHFTTEGQRITAATQGTSPAQAQRRKAGPGFKFFFVFALAGELQCSGLMSFLSMLSLDRSILMPNFLSLR